MPQYEEVTHTILSQTRQEFGASATAAEVVTLACDRLMVFFGCEILQHISGRISTEVDVRLSYDMEMVKSHRKKWRSA